MLENISDLYDLEGDVLLDVPGCLSITIQRALTRVCRELIYKSNIWQEDLPILDVVLKQTDYAISIPYNATIKNLTDIKVKQSIVQDFNNLRSTPQRYYDYIPENILRYKSEAVAPQQSMALGMRLSAILIPNFNSNAIPKWIFERYAEGFIAGAKAQLMVSPKKPYSNGDLAVFNQNKYNEFLTRACNDAERRFQPQTTSIGA